MTPEYTRYALYFCPPDGSEFEKRGAAWLGWDLTNGRSYDHPVLPDLDLTAITSRPRKYGFHATIKAPFRLAAGHTIEQLQHTIDTIATQTASFSIPGMEISVIGRFLALNLPVPCPPLQEMAEQFVEQLDLFRAPLTDAEIARRRKSRLTANQDAMLLRWGYPHVFDEFKFHMTLTGRLSDPILETVREAAHNHFGEVISSTIPVENICLCGENPDGQFQLISRHKF